jgi:hypothetical protein
VVFAAIAVFCCATALPDPSTVLMGQAAAGLIGARLAPPATTSQAALPDAPVAKILSAAKADSEAEDRVPGSSESVAAASQPFSNAPAKPAAQGGYETARQRKSWYGLAAVSSGAAVFDAWTTRRAVQGGYGVEGNPMLRPFSHSHAIYVATQASPLIMDYLGHRMMSSHHERMRRFWWVPQAAGTSVSLAAGVHNYLMVR